MDVEEIIEIRDARAIRNCLGPWAKGYQNHQHRFSCQLTPRPHCHCLAVPGVNSYSNTVAEPSGQSRTPANGAGLDGFFGWVLIRVLLDGWKRVTL